MEKIKREKINIQNSKKVISSMFQSNLTLQAEKHFQ